MGQMTYALMLCVEEAGAIDWCGEDGDGGLLGEWREACADRIAAFEAKHPRKSWQDPYGRDVYVPQPAYGAEPPVVGFYVAAGASGIAGVPDLHGFALGEAKTVYTDAYKAARRRWRRFARWAAAKGIVLPKARLHIVETEVA